MILYLQAKTTATDLMIDYIEVSLKDGTTVSLNWDESYIDRDETGFGATYKGVCFNEEHADGRIDELREMQVIDVGLYSEAQAPATILVTEMEFVDGDKRIRFATPYPKAEDAKIETEERSITMLRLIKAEGTLENANISDDHEIQYIFDKPGCGDDSETHTVREWLGEFGQPLQDAYYIKWTQTITQAGTILRKLEKECPKDIMEKVWATTYVLLYLNYDIAEDFDSRFDRNATNLLEFLSTGERTSSSWLSCRK